MAITNGYATLAEIKTYLSTSSTNDDVRLEKSIEAASRAIDAQCRRQFYLTSGTRYYSAEATDYISLPEDVYSVTSLAIDVGNRVYEVLSASQYELEPQTAPFSSVHTSPSNTRSFPVGRRAIQIVGQFGFCVAGQHPQAINAACLILAVRYFKRRDAAFGVLGTPELGFQRILAKDPEVKALLYPYVRLEVQNCG